MKLFNDDFRPDAIVLENIFWCHFKEEELGFKMSKDEIEMFIILFIVDL